jgi:hypothetical protein
MAFNTLTPFVFRRDGFRPPSTVVLFPARASCFQFWDTDPAKACSHDNSAAFNPHSCQFSFPNNEIDSSTLTL